MRDVHLTVAAVIQRGEKFLLVEERIGDRLVLNQPAGHWEAGETLMEAVRREALEETGWEIKPTSLLGIYEHEPPELGYGFLRFAFNATPVRHDPDRTLDTGIARALWLTPDELRHSPIHHRSPMVQRCVNDCLAGKQFPLSLILHL
ncbi:MAG: NUDIX hydrolase [Nevskiales bacterium]|nr:NUDIX hydrolase [Nevskiales bacterium]